ncbi:MAG: hypothetical protein Kow00103_05570 [Candidatus Caldatribacteriota bacterium]
MLKKKVVVKYRSGEIIKGWVEEFAPERHFFILYPLIEYSSKETLTIDFASLKAVFFVKDFFGNKNYQSVKAFDDKKFKVTPSQRKVVIVFEDGEEIYGTCYNFGRYEDGFFVFPIDPEDNNERIFVVRKAIIKIKTNDQDF